LPAVEHSFVLAGKTQKYTTKRDFFLQERLKAASPRIFFGEMFFLLNNRREIVD